MKYLRKNLNIFLGENIEQLSGKRPLIQWQLQFQLVLCFFATGTSDPGGRVSGSRLSRDSVSRKFAYQGRVYGGSVWGGGGG